MAFTAEQNQAIRDYVAANIDNPAAIAAAAAQFGVTANDLANAVGTSTAEVNAYFAQANVAPPPTATAIEQVAAPAATTAADLKQQLLQYSPEGAFVGEAYGGREGQVSQLANMLFQSGITDINQFGVRSVPIDPENPSAGLRPEYYNKATDQPLQSYGGLKYVADIAAQYDPNIASGTWQNVTPGQNLAFGQTWEGPGSTTFNVMFDAQGRPVFNTYSNSTSDDPAPLILAASLLGAPYLSTALAGAAPTALAAGSAANAAATGALLGAGSAGLTGGNVLKGALLGGLGGYAGNQLFGGGAGTSIETDASFLANDAAQLASQGLSEAQIAATLGASGYGSTAAANLAASMATNGLSVADMTTQLGNLSQTTGLMQQNYSPGEFLAYDALGLKGAVGNDFAAIEQNLIASGVDPLIAADVSQQLAFNPNITQSELASNLTKSFGGNVYDVNMAQTYPTSVLPGAGGTTTTAGTTTGKSASLKDVINVVKAGAVVAGLAGGANAMQESQTGFPIVPVPSDWKSPTYGQTGNWPALTPIDFGSPELLRGTQWEKYLNPNQPGVPAVATPQIGMDYSTLTNILQGGQGSALTLGDIISGIQSQYGQTNQSTMG